MQERVEGIGAPQAPPTVPKAPERLPDAKQARLTIDLSPQLHARFKAACAINRTLKAGRPIATVYISAVAGPRRNAPFQCLVVLISVESRR